MWHQAIICIGKWTAPYIIIIIILIIIIIILINYYYNYYFTNIIIHAWLVELAEKSKWEPWLAHCWPLHAKKMCHV